MNTFTKDPSTHPANCSLTEERLIRVRDELAAAAKRSDGGNLGYMMADAAKAIEELLALRKVEQEPVAWVSDKDKCDPDVFERGITACVLAISKHEAEAICRGVSAATGCKVDWHFVGGRVHIKVLCAAPQLPQPAVPTFDEWCVSIDNKPLGWVKDAMREAYDGCRDAMLHGAEPRQAVRNEHAEWSQSTFGNVGPVGPLKHLSKEALEAAAEPDDLIEWADMQFLLWDAQRRAGITDEQITQAMIEKLAINKARKWPEPKDGEPRLHIKSAPRQEAE